MILGEYGVISLFSAQNGKLESMASILDKRLDR